MTGGDNSIQVQTIARRQLLEMFGAVKHVIHGARPAAARIADSPILQVPGRRSSACERGTGMSGVTKTVGISPKSAVNEDDHRMWSRTFGHSKIAELHRILPVRNPSVG